LSKLPSGRAPERRFLEGRLAVVEPLDISQHSEPLYLASHETPEAKQIWTYLPDGPFNQFSDFKAWLGAMANNPDRAVFAVRDRETARIGGNGYVPRHSAKPWFDLGRLYLVRTIPAT